MPFYQIMSATGAERDEILRVFPTVSEVRAEDRQRVLDAFCTVWKSSSFASLEDAPFSKHSTHYPLCRHINEVVDFGRALAAEALARWDDRWTAQYDANLLLELLLLHDLDKYLLLSETGAKPPIADRIAHGTLSALLLQELGFDERLIGLVSTHSPSSSLHTADPLAQILHYADLFSADHIFMLVDRIPAFCKKD